MNPLPEGQRLCTATTRTGQPCKSFARRDSEYCNLHAGDVDPADVARTGGLKKADNRAVRERLADAAAEDYELIRKALREAIDSEVVRWGDCPNCKHRVPVSFPDINARTKAIQVWLDQGFGRPAQEVRVEQKIDAPDPLAMTKEQRQRIMQKLVAQYPDIARERPGSVN